MVWLARLWDTRPLCHNRNYFRPTLLLKRYKLGHSTSTITVEVKEYAWGHGNNNAWGYKLTVAMLKTEHSAVPHTMNDKCFALIN